MPDRCIFCSEKHLTDEDIWPTWFKAWLRRKNLNTKFQLTRVQGDQETVLHPSSQSVGGKRRILCHKCNTKRFEPIQRHASRIIKPMLDYSWAPMPREDIVLVWPDQEVLASWATMTAMTAEFLPLPMPDNDETFFTRDERIKFRRTHKPFKGMVIEASYYFGDRTTGVHFSHPKPPNPRFGHGCTHRCRCRIYSLPRSTSGKSFCSWPSTGDPTRRSRGTAS